MTAKGSYIRDAEKDPMLAYVHWFSKPSTTAESPINMYVVHRLQRASGALLGDVVDLATFVRPLHLVPKFGMELDPDISQHNALNIAKNFYVNCFWDKEIYQAVY